MDDGWWREGIMYDSYVRAHRRVFYLRSAADLFYLFFYGRRGKFISIIYSKCMPFSGDLDHNLARTDLGGKLLTPGVHCSMAIEMAIERCTSSGAIAIDVLQ